MPEYTCPYCQGAYTAPVETSATHARCPHCDRAIELPRSPAARWFYARNKKKYGPFTWNQLVALVNDGEVRAEDHLLQEGTKTWVRAGAMAALFGKPGDGSPKAKSAAKTGKASAVAPPAAKPAARGRWLAAGFGSVVLGFAPGLAILAVWYFTREPPLEPRLADQDKPALDKKPDQDAPGKIDPPKKDPEPKPKDNPPPPPPIAPHVQQLLARLNRARQSAGLGSVAFDADLGRGCLAHAQYLAKNVDPASPNAADLRKQDPNKPGYSLDGQRAAEVALLGFGAPDTILDHWLGKLVTREALLNTEMLSVGIGFAEASAENWFCVVDAVRGQGARIVVFPGPRQDGTPASFSSGPEAPKDKPAGFPITVTFPPGQNVTDARIDVVDAKGNSLDGWRWTPEKPAPASDQRNTIAFISKGLLTGNSLYQVKSSAQVGGKPWSQAWSFTTDDDSDAKGTWAKKALARLNSYRASAGLKPVVLDETLHRACLKHARYLVINEGHPALQGLKAHGEDLSLPGARSEEHT